MEALTDDMYTVIRFFAIEKKGNSRVQNLFFARQNHVMLLVANPDGLHLLNQ